MIAILEKLENKDNSAAYKYLLELEEKSAESNELYYYFDEFVKMVHHKSSYVRTRGFRLCCAQAQWDTENKWELHMEELLGVLKDDKPTTVRQCLEALHTVILYKQEACGVIEKKLKTLDCSKYKDSMRPLIEKDLAELQAML